MLAVNVNTFWNKITFGLPSFENSDSFGTQTDIVLITHQDWGLCFGVFQLDFSQDNPSEAKVSFYGCDEAWQPKVAEIVDDRFLLWAAIIRPNVAI